MDLGFALVYVAAEMSNAKPSIILHVGMPKTGTKTLQRGLFAGHSGLIYLGKPFRDNRIYSVTREISSADSIRYDAAKCEAALRDVLNSALNNGKPVILSEEEFAHYNRADRGVVAKRLQRAYPCARILLTFRKQEEQLESFYFHKLNGLVMRDHYVTFDEWAFEEEQGLRDNSVFGDLNYFNIYKAYVEAFGASNVCVLLLEQLINEPDLYIHRLCTFIGIDEDEARRLIKGRRDHSRMSARLYTWGRIKGYVIPRGVAKLLRAATPRTIAKALEIWIRAGTRARLGMSNRWKRELAARYGASNRCLADASKLDLAKFGYSLSGNENSNAEGNVAT